MTRLELTNQLPQVILFLVCVAPLQTIGYDFSPIFYYYASSSGYDGNLIPVMFVLIPFPLFYMPWTSLYQPSDFYVNNFGLTHFDLKMDLLVFFTDISLYFQELFTHTGPMPTKIYLNFCWLNSSVNFKINFKLNNLLIKSGKDLVSTTWPYLLTKNLKLIPDQGKMTIPNFKSIKFPAPQKRRNNLIKFPAPRVQACCNTMQGKLEGTFLAWHSMQHVKHSPNIVPKLWKTPHNNPSLLQELGLDSEIQLDNFTDMDIPYQPGIDDQYIIYPTSDPTYNCPHMVFTAYKRVDKKIHPISMQLPPDFEVIRQIPEDPLLTLPPLTNQPPEFIPTAKITPERMEELNVNSTGFLWPEEEKLFQHVMKLNENGIAFEDIEQGTLKETYFSPYIIPTIPHTPWEYKNIPIPPGLMQKVLEVLKLKIAAEVYEQSQSSYRSRWFVVLKKNGKLRIVHDLQPLNKVTIRDAGMVPIIDDFVEGFAARQCYTVFDLFWGFDTRKIHPKSRGLTAFMTPLGLLQITSLPTGFTNSPAEFQKCMVMVLKDEIPHMANIFIDDLPIKGPTTQYLDMHGKPEVLKENPGIRRFVWEHAQDVHRVLH